MKASIFHSRGNIRCEDVPDLVISSPGQMIVAIEATSICGSDLYLYEGPFDALVPGGHVTGHEILGRVIDVGKDVARFRKGDRTTTPFSLACHHCAMCEIGMTGHCETTQNACYGYGPASGNLGGSHAEAAIVHLADVNARIVPDSIAAADAITLSCNLPTALLGVEAAGLKPGETIAIVGCGPTALMTLDLVLKRQPGRVVVLDRVPHRLAVAAAKGVVAINIDEADWLDRARAEAGRSGFDRVIEVVGSNESIGAALSLIRPGGTIVGLGCFAVPEIRMDPFIASLRNINIRMEGTANVAMATEQALQMLLDGEVSPRDYFTHEYALENIDGAWADFSAKDSGIIKALIRP